MAPGVRVYKIKRRPSLFWICKLNSRRTIVLWSWHHTYKGTGKSVLARELPKKRRRAEIPALSNWQRWCPSAGTITLRNTPTRVTLAADAMIAQALEHRLRTPASHRKAEAMRVRAPQWPLPITSAKTNPICAASNPAGTRLRMTGTSLPGLFPVLRNASRASLSRRTGRPRLSGNEGRTETLLYRHPALRAASRGLNKTAL